jgi:phosphomannomutase
MSLRRRMIAFDLDGTLAVTKSAIAKKYAWDADGAKKRALRDFDAQRLPDLEVHLGGTTSVDVTNTGIDRPTG